MNKQENQQLNALALDAKTAHDKQNELFVLSMPLLLRLANGFVMTTNMFVKADELINDFALKFNYYVQRFDPDGSMWSTFIINRFKYFCLDCARDKANHPTCQHTNRLKTKSLSATSFDAQKPTDRAGGRTLHDETAAPGMQPQSLAYEDLFRYFKGLNQQRRLLMICLYCEDMTMKATGECLAVSESRVSQLHTATLKQIKGTIAEMADVDECVTIPAWQKEDHAAERNTDRLRSSESRAAPSANQQTVPRTVNSQPSSRPTDMMRTATPSTESFAALPAA